MKKAPLGHTIGLSVLILGFLAPIAPAATAEQVENAIHKAVGYLYSIQQNGTWENDPAGGRNDQETGATAVACYALLAAGETPANNPKLAAAIEWLKKNDTTNGTYALAMRMQVWNLLPHDKDESVRNVIRRDGLALLDGARRSKGPAFRGQHSYVITNRDDFDSSCSQYGVLGIWALSHASAEVPDDYWRAVESAWIGDQYANGSWAYRPQDGHNDPSISMTAAGIATLFITQDYLRAGDGISCHGNSTNMPLAKGIAWMNQNLPVAMQKHLDYYGLYGISRIGVASGVKYFGGLDWYQAGADQLVHEQGADGNWKGDWSYVPGTSFGILFLCRGRAPVVMNKLQYSIDGKEANWNQRPRDAANAVRYVARQMERDLNWQTVNLTVDVNELHDSPILYIAGNQLLKFTPEEETKLKTFVEQGGLILGQADCGEAAFVKSFKSLGMKLFPTAGEFRKLPADHVIFTKEQFAAKTWRNKPEVVGLSNHVRELMLLLPAGDPGKAWQINDVRSREESFQLLSDIFLYTVEGKDLHYKGSTYIVTDDKHAVTNRTIKIARLQAGENYDPEPGGWQRLASVMHNQNQVAVQTQLIKPTDPSLKDFPMAHLTGASAFKLSDADGDAIKLYVAGGGTLVIDAAGGDSEFAASAEEMLHNLFGQDADQLNNPISADHPLFGITGAPLGEISFRTFARDKVGRHQTTPLLRGITLNGRLAVIFSREDLSAGLVGQTIDGVNGYSPTSATALMQDIVLFVGKDAK